MFHFHITLSTSWQKVFFDYDIVQNLFNGRFSLSIYYLLDKPFESFKKGRQSFM